MQGGVAFLSVGLGPPRPLCGLGLFLISGGASRHRWDLLLIGGGQHMIDKNLKVQEIPTMNCSNFCPD